MEIIVTQRHIDSGKASDCRLCPVALAILDACRGSLLYVDVSNVDCWMRFRSSPHMQQRQLPPIAREFIGRFDRYDADMRRSMKPFSFDLPI